MWHGLRSLLRVVTRRRAFESEMRDELRFHLEQRAADLERRGLTPGEARRRARLEFGNPAAWQEHCREARGLRAVDELRQDVRVAVRAIGRRPLVSVIVVVTLTFGIGISSGVFTMLAAATLRPQLPDPEGTFVGIYTALPTDPSRPRRFAQATLAQYVELRNRLTMIRPLAASRNVGATVGTGGSSQRVLLVSCTFFEVYGVPRAALGRLFDARDCERRDAVVVLANDTWRHRFGGDPAIVGRTISIAGLPVNVIGVAAGDFPPDGGAAWLPFTMRDAMHVAAQAGADGGDRWLNLAGRLVPGATLAQAQAEAAVAAAALDVARPNQRTEILVTDGSLIQDPNVRANVLGVLTLVVGALTALVLIVCGNVATLLLSQSAARQQEMAIRLALGAGRARLVRMLLAETLLLAACAGVGSYFVACAMPRVLLVWLTERSPTFPMVPDWRVFAYLTASAGIAGIAAGLAPALDSLRADIVTSLTGQRAWSGHPSRSRPLSMLVAGQVALGFVLLTGAALFLGTHYQTIRRHVGYEAGQVLMPRVAYQRTAGAPQSPPPGLLRDVLAAVPGTAAVAFAATAPGFSGAKAEVVVRAGVPVTVDVNEVSPGFFATIRLPIVRGRAFDATDRSCDAGPCVAVVSQALAARLFAAGDAVGRSLPLRKGTDVTIVGIAADTSVTTIGRADGPALYLPWHDGGEYQALVRFDGAADGFAARAGAALRERFRGSIVDTQTLRWPLENWIQEVGGVEQLVVALGLAAAALAALGVFGIVSFAVSRREHEFGIRIALGATRARIYATVIQTGSRPVLAGLGGGAAMGLLAAIGFGGVLAELQFTLSPLDPRIYLAAAVPLTLVIAAALLIPARRATRADPIRALRLD